MREVQERHHTYKNLDSRNNRLMLLCAFLTCVACLHLIFSFGCQNAKIDYSGNQRARTAEPDKMEYATKYGASEEILLILVSNYSPNKLVEEDTEIRYARAMHTIIWKNGRVLFYDSERDTNYIIKVDCMKVEELERFVNEQFRLLPDDVDSYIFELPAGSGGELYYSFVFFGENSYFPVTTCGFSLDADADRIVKSNPKRGDVTKYTAGEFSKAWKALKEELAKYELHESNGMKSVPVQLSIKRTDV